MDPLPHVPFPADALAPTPYFDTYERWGEKDRARVGPGWLTLWAVRSGEAMFFARDAAGNNKSLTVREGDVVPLPGVPGWSVELLGCRPRAVHSPAWAAVRTVHAPG